MKIEKSKRFAKLAPYAFAEINKKVAALREAGVKAIDFGVGDPSEPTPDFVIEGLGEAARKHACSGYPSYVGSGEYRAACARYMAGRFGVSLDPETEMCSNIGSKEAIFNFPEGFVNPGDIVICPSPGYPPMKTGTIFAEGEPYYVPLLEENDFLIDYEVVPAEVCERARIIWLNYPNSPTGAVASREWYEGFLAWARKWEIIVAADEGCYIDIYFGDDAPGSILEVAAAGERPYEGVVAFYSLSKRNNMTGYRVGFVCGDARIIEIYKALKTNIDSGTPNFVQEAAMLAMADDEHVASMRELYKKKGEILMGALREMGLTVRKPGGTFYLWIKVGDDLAFAERLLDPAVGIVVTPGSLISDECSMVGKDGAVRRVNPGAGYVRFALMPTMEEVEEAAVKIRRLVL